MAERGKQPPDILERTFNLGLRVDALCRYLRETRLVPGHRISQLERAGSAVGALVEEAQGGESTADFLHKMSIALKEARETFYWLRQLLASKLVPVGRLEGLTDEARQIKLILAAIVNSTRRNMGEDEVPEPPGDEIPSEEREPPQDDLDGTPVDEPGTI